ncbi:hypothetical protein JB92DRAFT_3131329 [Gautieria morchelliformis]|nr:hypothetical protein JB92DRAFT_3131329 [Gautieria morchelliformis]
MVGPIAFFALLVSIIALIQFGLNEHGLWPVMEGTDVMLWARPIVNPPLLTWVPELMAQTVDDEYL